MMRIPGWVGLVFGVMCAPLAAASAQAAQKTPTARVLVWNVSDSDWVKQAEASRAVLRHADPDVFLLVEVDTNIGAAGVRRMLNGLRGPSDTTWSISVRGPGDIEHSVIASRAPVRELPEFARLTYPDTGRVAALTAYPDSGVPVRDRIRRVHANGALVRVRGHDLLVVGVHLTCCNTTGIWREHRREAGAAIIRDAVRRAVTRTGVQAVVEGGDMNLAAGPAPLDSVLSAFAARPVGPMRRADALQFDDWSDWTWDGRGTAFNGGRLDNVVYSSGTLGVALARVWDTESMPADTLRAHHLVPETSKSINRHRPIVVDLRFLR